MIWWEDFKVGERSEMGRHTFSEDEILAFGRQFDPQPFHTDPEAARATPFGGLIASGWHTCAVGMRLMVDQYIGRTASLGSPGIEDIRWLKPVLAGDTINAQVRVVDKKPSRSRPEMGSVFNQYEVHNQHGALVMTMKGVGLIRRRQPN